MRRGLTGGERVSKSTNLKMLRDVAPFGALRRPGAIRERLGLDGDPHGQSNQNNRHYNESSRQPDETRRKRV